MSVIKTTAFAIRLVPKAANHGDGTVGGTHLDINTHKLVFLEILPYHNSTVGIRVWYLHFHSGCVAELGAGSWVFLFPVPLSFSGH